MPSDPEFDTTMAAEPVANQTPPAADAAEDLAAIFEDIFASKPSVMSDCHWQQQIL